MWFNNILVKIRQRIGCDWEDRHWFGTVSPGEKERIESIEYIMVRVSLGF